MKKTFIAVAAMAMVAAVSCQKDNMEPQPAGKTVSIKASVEQQMSTRTALSGDSVVWSENDALAVFGTENPSAISTFTYSGTAGDVEGNFTGTEVAGTMVAVYPQSIVAEGTGLVSSDGKYSVPVTIPAEQTYVEGSFSNNANVAVAVGTESLAFKNVMSVLKLQFYGTTARTITKVQLAAAEPLCGEATLSVATDGTDPQLVFDEVKSSKVLTLNVPEVAFGTDETAPTVFYFVVPANALTNGFTVSVENTASNDTFYALAKTTADNTTIRSIITEMGAKAVTFNISKSKLANTLIVEPSSEVNIFPLQPVTGNLLCHHKSISGYGYSKADAKGTYSNYPSGYAKYTATDTKGYYICVMKDYNDDIQWSWTVWTTETPGDFYLTNGFVIMDRNLGAMAGERADDVTATDLRGLYYQWGRKDPLFNYKSNAIACSAESGTLEYVTRNPFAYIIPSEGSEYPSDWLWKGNGKLWGKTKTEYDPCPAGYRVPDGNTDTLSFWVGCDFIGNAGTYDTNYKGYDFNVLEDDTSIFLVGGYVSYDTATATPTLYANGYYWCSNTVTYTNNNNHYGRVYSFSGSKAPAKGGLAKYCGAQIRCQKIK